MLVARSSYDSGDPFRFVRFPCNPKRLDFKRSRKTLAASPKVILASSLRDLRGSGLASLAGELPEPGLGHLQDLGFQALPLLFAIAVKAGIISGTAMLHQILNLRLRPNVPVFGLTHEMGRRRRL
jgi:hypothetical protein